MKLKVKCVGYKANEQYFTIGKIYEWEYDTLYNDNGFRYGRYMVGGQDPSKWALSQYYKFEVVEVENVEFVAPSIHHIPKLDVKPFMLNIKKTTQAMNKLAKEMKLGKYKVIFNKPATILFVDGKKYVSKAHNEEFDEEKGLLMCLAKANGITHLDLKKLIKNAKRGK